MNHSNNLVRVKKVETLPEFILELIFDNDEIKYFDMKPYLEIGMYKKLKNKDKFATAKVSFGTVCWDDELDIDPDTLYEKSKKTL